MDYDQLYESKNEVYYSHQRQELLPYIPIGIKKALDIGCGDGAFGSILKQHTNCEIWGIEPSKAAADMAVPKLDKVITGLFSKNLPELSGQTFDAIFFNDVLEHLVNPDEILTQCKNFLNANGYIVASIPNIRWYPVILSLLRYKDFKYENAGVMDKTHMRFFTKKSMIRMFENSGYKVLTIDGINKNKSFKFFNLLNLLLLGTQEDMKYPQFVIVATLPADAR